MPSWEGTSHGVGWQLELERAALLPGRLVGGTVTVTAGGAIDGRSLRVTLVGTESWQHDETTTDAEGHTHTETVTSKVELPRVPVELASPVRLAAGERHSFPFQLPVPELGPASVEATVLKVEWVVEAKIDQPGFDSRLEVPVRIVQPVALLRAGVVRVGEFALYPAADAVEGDITGSVELDPMPLCAGAPFRGRLVVRSPEPRTLQELRAEVRVHVEATVSSGKQETVTLWARTLAPAMQLSGEGTFEIAGELADVALPTIETAHGRTAATFHVILAVAWARDPHLVRDVTIATTLEL